MAIYGYARASTLEQNVTIQEDALRRAGCEVIRSEKVSGRSRAGRSELALLLQFLRDGDTLMVTRVDRLARSIKIFRASSMSCGRQVSHSMGNRTARSTPRAQLGRRSSTCSACLPNSRPISRKRHHPRRLRPTDLTALDFRSPRRLGDSGADLRHDQRQCRP